MNILNKILGIKDISKEFEVPHVPGPKKKAVDKESPQKQLKNQDISQLSDNERLIYQRVLDLKKKKVPKSEVIKSLASYKNITREVLSRMMEIVETIYK